jgi:8-oxo-dGTP diphosphatase
MDWTGWEPQERATLCFIVEGDHVLLIHKKRGLGAGKINAPGGRLEPGETAREATIRETQEEICVTPLDPEWAGTLHFQFTDGYKLHCEVYRSSRYAGTPTSTPEADPVWIPKGAIPYESMWSDDRLWLPLLLECKPFKGYFEFDGEQMLSDRIEILDPSQVSSQT